MKSKQISNSLLFQFKPNGLCLVFEEPEKSAGRDWTQYFEKTEEVITEWVWKGSR